MKDITQLFLSPHSRFLLLILAIFLCHRLMSPCTLSHRLSLSLQCLMCRQCLHPRQRVQHFNLGIVSTWHQHSRWSINHRGKNTHTHTHTHTHSHIHYIHTYITCFLPLLSVFAFLPSSFPFFQSIHPSFLSFLQIPYFFLSFHPFFLFSPPFLIIFFNLPFFLQHLLNFIFLTYLSLSLHYFPPFCSLLPSFLYPTFPNSLSLPSFFLYFQFPTFSFSFLSTFLPFLLSFHTFLLLLVFSFSFLTVFLLLFFPHLSSLFSSCSTPLFWGPVNDEVL